MQYHADKHGSKLPILFLLFIIVYLAFFDFDIKKAINYTVEQNKQLFGR